MKFFPLYRVPGILLMMCLVHFFFACSVSDKKYKYPFSEHLVKVKDFSLSNQTLKSSTRVSDRLLLFDGSDFVLYSINKDDGTLVSYNFTTNQFTDYTIRIIDSLHIDHHSIFMIKDSLLILSGRNNTEIILLNIYTKILKKINIYQEPDSNQLLPILLPKSEPYFNENYVVYGLVSEGYNIIENENFRHYFRNNAICVVDTIQKKKYYIERFPTNYTEEFYYDFYPKILPLEGDSFAVSFQFSDSISVYNLPHNLVRRIEVKPDQRKKFEGIDPGKANNRKRLMEYIYSRNQYSDLYYNAARKEIYRIYKPPVSDIYSDKGLLIDMANIPFEMLVYRNNETIMELQFEKSNLNSSMLAYNSRFMLFENHKLNNDSITYTLFQWKD